MLYRVQAGPVECGQANKKAGSAPLRMVGRIRLLKRTFFLLEGASGALLFFRVARHFPFNKFNVLADLWVVFLTAEFLGGFLLILGHVVGITRSSSGHHSDFFAHNPNSLSKLKREVLINRSAGSGQGGELRSFLKSRQGRV